MNKCANHKNTHLFHLNEQNCSNIIYACDQLISLFNLERQVDVGETSVYC